MNPGKSLTKLLLLALSCALSVDGSAEGQRKPLSRAFAAASEERYEVTITLKAQTQIVSIETLQSKSYLIPVMYPSEPSLKRRTRRRILSTGLDGRADIERLP